MKDLKTTEIAKVLRGPPKLTRFCPSLYNDTTEGGASVTFRFKGRSMGLGPYELYKLSEWHEKSRQLRRLVREGVDPIERRRTERMAAAVSAAKAMTFEECAERYIAAHQAGWRNPKHAKQWPATLEAYVYPIFGDLPVQEIDVALVMKALDPIWHEKPETAARVRGRI